MLKNSKCINIFEEKEKNFNLYTVNIILILLITLMQLSIGIFKYTQLNSFILDNKDYNINSNIKTEDTQQCNINLLEMKDLCSLIGAKNINSIVMNAEGIEVIGSCKSMKKIKLIKNRDIVEGFDISSIEKKDGRYVFTISYKRID